ncbi:hypothetical protein BR93DRAFT_930310 [Coniochaeta sp. PMI_546]|nr:hypothetical protein BR93DRAFT_930310 [Coniochaeta sp. PMI_546]
MASMTILGCGVMGQSTLLRLSDDRQANATTHCVLWVLYRRTIETVCPGFHQERSEQSKVARKHAPSFHRPLDGLTAWRR